TQAAHRALALCHDWRDIGGRHPAPGRLKDLRDEHLTYSALALAFGADCRLTIRAGGNRQLTWHKMPTERMGPAARSFAADAHDCIMVRIQTDLPHTSVRREDAGAYSRPKRRRRALVAHREEHLREMPSGCCTEALRHGHPRRPSAWRKA